MKHYLITGGAGFIGSNLIKTIFEQEEGIRISCVDNFDPFYSADIKHLNIRSFATDQCFKLINCDLATVDHKKIGRFNNRSCGYHYSPGRKSRRASQH